MRGRCKNFPLFLFLLEIVVSLQCNIKIINLKKMTDRERWVDTLNKGNVDLNIAFKYFVEKGGNPDAEAFRMIFKLLPEAREAVYNTLNTHFEVVVYEDDVNNIVKFY